MGIYLRVACDCEPRRHLQGYQGNGKLGQRYYEHYDPPVADMMGSQGE